MINYHCQYKGLFSKSVVRKFMMRIQSAHAGYNCNAVVPCERNGDCAGFLFFGCHLPILFDVLIKPSKFTN
jgi:hypothetical protein